MAIRNGLIMIKLKMRFASGTGRAEITLRWRVEEERP